MQTSAILPHEQDLLNRKDDLLLVDYSFPADLTNDLTRATLAAYWRSRRFDLRENREGNIWLGRRGNLMGNLFAFDVRKRLSQVLIEAHDGYVTARLLLDFQFQIVTEWDLLDHKLEMGLFRCAMEQRPLPEYFRQLPYKRLPSQAAWLFFGCFSVFLGRCCPAEYHEELVHLCRGELPEVSLKKKPKTIADAIEHIKTPRSFHY